MAQGRTPQKPTRNAPEKPRRKRLPARLRYVDDTTPGLRRRRSGSGFVYLDARGRRVTNEATLARIRALAIPPAYTQVWICPHANGHIQATGRDARGRKQYRYHANWRAFRDAAKFADLADFGRGLGALRRRLAREIKRPTLDRPKVAAIAASLLDRTLVRVGNDEYARSNSSYGLTTLRTRHVRVGSRRVEFRFRGKGGKSHAIVLSDARLARQVRNCLEIPGQRLFQYYGERGRLVDLRSTDVNDYLREVCGREVTAKHFRTWGATVRMVRYWQESLEAQPELEPHERQAQCYAAVAQRLGNTPAVCRKSYVHPEVATALETGTLGPLPAATRGALDPSEVALLAFLRRHHSRHR